MIQRATLIDSDQDYMESIAMDPEAQLESVLRAARNLRSWFAKQVEISIDSGEKEMAERAMMEMDIKFRGML